MELVRKILMRVQDKKDLQLEILSLEGVDELAFGRHMEMLYDEGLVEGSDYIAMDDNFKAVFVKDLSWEGHEFISAIKNDSVWQRMKDVIGIKELSGMPLKAVKDVAIAMTGAYLKSKLGLG